MTSRFRIDDPNAAGVIHGLIHIEILPAMNLVATGFDPMLELRELLLQWAMVRPHFLKQHFHGGGRRRHGRSNVMASSAQALLHDFQLSLVQGNFAGITGFHLPADTSERDGKLNRFEHVVIRTVFQTFDDGFTPFAAAANHHRQTVLMGSGEEAGMRKTDRDLMASRLRPLSSGNKRGSTIQRASQKTVTQGLITNMVSLLDDDIRHTT
ncbi:MAG: hypothetical protein ACI9TH_002930, partial [Kiritimatiellia bacterium]